MDEFGHDSSSNEFVRFVNACLTVFSSLTCSGWLISWFASFKLVLFSFDKGPLSYDPPLVSSSSPSPMTFLRFLVIACLPIKVKQSNQSSVRTYMHGLHYYVLEDFWGRRWNLAASDILRSNVYEPVRHAIKRSWGVYIAILVTFFISGLMHELLIFYLLSTLLMNGFLVCSCFWLLFPFFGRFKFPFMVMEDIANFTKLLNNVLLPPFHFTCFFRVFFYVPK
ncbi:hypothetical protein MKX03_018873 [Papaver bracteatum]|nr:hypothetical protein MKX03_018873 [Papaver bracteatum]